MAALLGIKRNTKESKASPKQKTKVKQVMMKPQANE
jgi:hypothetical protein